MRRIRENWIKWVFGVAMTLVLAFLMFAMDNAYQTYTSMIVQQQQQHLLLQTKAVAQNLELYMSEQLRQIGILTQTPGFMDAMEEYSQTGEKEHIKEYIFSYMLSDRQGASRMYLLDADGEQIFHYNRYPFLEEFDEELLQLNTSAREGQSGIGTVFPISENHYGLTLVNSVYGGNGYLGTAISIYDINDIYERFLVPLTGENMGTIIVKDEAGTVLMHPVSAMLGFNAERDIAGFRESRQYDSMNRMLDKQYNLEVGTAIYDAFSGGIEPTDKKIAAFSRMNLWGTSWYISAEIPYSRAMSIELENLRRFSMLFGAVMVVVLFGGVVIYVLMRNRQKLKLETKYLKEINSTLEELHQSQEEARHYQKLTTIGSLAGGIVHEFNNLLTPILGYSEFLLGQVGKGSEYYDDIEEIRKAGIRAKEIVEQILPFSRKETGTEGFKSLKLDVVMLDAFKMVDMIRPSNIRLEQHLNDGDANIYGNATQIHQVLLNLYSNGMQSMEKKGGALTISTRRIRTESMPGSYREIYGGISNAEYVEIQVSDTGCGMEPKIQSQIFSPFFTTKASGEGTGLGLAVVKDILVNHGGFIKVDSKPGEGSCFHVYIPVSGELSAMQTAVAGMASPRLEEASIVLIDDEERIVKYLVKCLKRKGYRIDGYTSAEEALEIMRQEPGRWNVAVIDYMMPHVKGTALAHRIKILQPDMGIIMITGLVEADALQMCKEGLIEKILIKPLNIEELIEAVETTVSHQGTEREGDIL